MTKVPDEPFNIAVVCRSSGHPKKKAMVALFGSSAPGLNWSAWPADYFNARVPEITQWILDDGTYVDMLDPDHVPLNGRRVRVRYLLVCKLCPMRVPVRAENMHRILDNARLAGTKVLELTDVAAKLISSKTD
jgi:hypothetical protein